MKIVRNELYATEKFNIQAAISKPPANLVGNLSKFAIKDPVSENLPEDQKKTEKEE